MCLPNAMCLPGLNSGSKKSTLKDIWGNLNMDERLNNIKKLLLIC